MNNEDLKIDFERFMKDRLDPINQKMIEQEKANKHNKFLEKHSDNFTRISDKHSSMISQLITLEGVIFAAIIIFSEPETITVWILFSICLILISLIFGIWLQNIKTQSDYQSHEWDYKYELESSWWRRELWKDETVGVEKELIQSNLNERDMEYKKTYTYKVLKFFKLNHDRVENIFKATFLLALLFLIFHFINGYLLVKDNLVINDKPYVNKFNKLLK